MEAADRTLQWEAFLGNLHTHLWQRVHSPDSDCRSRAPPASVAEVAARLLPVAPPSPPPPVLAPAYPAPAACKVPTPADWPATPWLTNLTIDDFLCKALCVPRAPDYSKTQEVVDARLPKEGKRTLRLVLRQWHNHLLKEAVERRQDGWFPHRSVVMTLRDTRGAALCDIIHDIRMEQSQPLNDDDDEDLPDDDDDDPLRFQEDEEDEDDLP